MIDKDSTQDNKHKTKISACAILLVAFMVVLALRGPVRSITMSQDFAVYYCCARTWLHGENCYDTETLRQTARDAGGAPELLLEDAMNPPTTFVLLASIAWMPWQAAIVTWMCLNLLAITISLIGLLKLSKIHLTLPRKLLLCALIIALVPMHTAIALGQLSVVVLMCIVWAIVCDVNKRPYLSGVLLAIATCLKPQCGVIYFLYFALKWQWRPLVAGIVTGGLLLTIGVLRLEMFGIDWFASMKTNYDTFLLGGRGDVSRLSFRHQFLQFQYPMHVLLGNKFVANAITWSAAGTIGLIVLLTRQKATRERRIALYATLGIIGLIVFYHRTYDAVLVALPILWAMGTCHAISHRAKIAILILAAPFLVVPWPSTLYVFAQKGIIPAGIADSWVWQAFVLPHQAYLLMAMAIILTASMWRASRCSAEAENATGQEALAGSPADTTPPCD